MQAIPIVNVKILKNEFGQAVLVLRCPFCNQEHQHTCDGPAPVLGIRAAHCTGRRTGLLAYELVKA
jgi:hypothetical protein